jgi:multimeric flavodoxin WrbA
MKILLINAGAKNYGATQEILTIIENYVPNTSTVNSICLGDVHVQFCKGCKSCYDKGKCLQEDDMEAIMDEIDYSDIIIVASPSYWADIPGQFKVFIDRCTVYSDTNPNPNHRILKPGKKCYAIALRTGKRPMECEHIIESIKHWCGHMKIDMIDSMYFCEVSNKEDIMQYKDSIIENAKRWFVTNTEVNVTRR